MDPGAVPDASKGQHPQLIAAETLQAALAALLPGASGGAAQLLHIPPTQPLPAQSIQAQLELLSQAKQPSKRKAARSAVEEAANAGPPRPPPIKHEVYEDLEEKFNQLQSEREPKRHRGNPKGYQIKSFCKNPACGKQLNGGRTNRCEHCGFDLASHRRNSQLERLIKSGPLSSTQVRTALRDAANEVHVRTGGKAVVLTLVYIEGAAPAPAQAIAYGKPAASFVESRKELITTFEAACREHFREQHLPAEPQPQQPPPPPQLQAGAAAGPSLGIAPPLASQPAGTVAAAGPATAPASNSPAAARPCALGPSSQLLSAVNTAAVAAAAAAAAAVPGGMLQPGAAAALPLPLAAAAAHSQPVDLDAVIGAVLSNPAAAIARCREARVSGDVLARLPQSMQLTVLMQAGLLPGEAASVVVELESRQRLQQLPTLPLATLSQQLAQQLSHQQQHHQQQLSHQQQHHHQQQQQQQQHGAQSPQVPAAAAAVSAPLPPLGTTLVPSPHPHPAVTQPWGLGAAAAGAGAAAVGPSAPVHSCIAGLAGGSVPGGSAYQQPGVATGGGVVPGGAASAAAAAVPLLGPLQAALMAAAVGVGGSAVDPAGGVGMPPAASHGQQQQLEGLLAAAQVGAAVAGGVALPGFGASHPLLHAAGQLPVPDPGQPLQPPQL